MMKTILFASLAATVLADKDSGYYPEGFSNPNVDNKMYWKEPFNVMDDLQQFSKLYVTFNNCA